MVKPVAAEPRWLDQTQPMQTGASLLGRRMRSSKVKGDSSVAQDNGLRASKDTIYNKSQI